ncbi:MAG: YbaK/EbsC family protein [Acidimicrobiales bacterium]
MPLEANRQLKTLVMVADSNTILVVVRGDHQLNVQKLLDSTGAITIRPAEAESRPSRARVPTPAASPRWVRPPVPTMATKLYVVAPT